MIAVVDYGAGNLRSVARALAAAGAPNVEITADPARIANASRVVLPGVGAFAQCITALRGAAGIEAALAEAVVARGTPFLGICVGMQMMATVSREYHDTAGFDWIPGEVVKVTPSDRHLKVPHMGWNDLVIDHPHPVLAGIANGDHAYFVHSYQFQVTDPAHRLAHVDYAGDVTAIIGRATMIGTQFHPEKSQKTGLRLIGNFLTWRP